MASVARCPCIKPWGVAPPGHSEAARQSEDGHQCPHAPGGHSSPGFSCQVSAPALTTGFVTALLINVCMTKGTISPHCIIEFWIYFKSNSSVISEISSK